MFRSFFLLLSVTLIAANAAAHPGHDHGSWASDYLHFLFYGAFALAGAALIVVLFNKLFQRD